MSILNKIIVNKKREVALKKSVVNVKQLLSYELFERTTISLSSALIEIDFGIIAEHKRRSPSKPNINSNFSVEEIVKGYEMSGVCGISVLTDMKYFGGSIEDLVLARAAVSIPILRKEFIFDEYQIIEAKANGADAILLIASVLKKYEIKILSEFAQSLGLEVLLEVHNLAELEKSLMPSLNIIGVNNRNLRTFEVDLVTSINLSEFIPAEFLKVSESGIQSSREIITLQECGFNGFLIGESFMKTTNPGKAAAEFIAELRTNNSVI